MMTYAKTLNTEAAKRETGVEESPIDTRAVRVSTLLLITKSLGVPVLLWKTLNMEINAGRTTGGMVSICFRDSLSGTSQPETWTLLTFTSLVSGRYMSTPPSLCLCVVACMQEESGAEMMVRL